MLARKVLWLGVVSFVTLCWKAGPAPAALYGFTPVTFHSGAAADAVAAQLSLDVTQSGSLALFTFANNGPVPSTITGAYFDDGAGMIDGLVAPINGSGVRFRIGGRPANLAGPNVSHDFGADFWAVDRTPRGLGERGVDNTGETVTIPLLFGSGGSFADVLVALDAGVWDPTSGIGTLRVGIRVQSIDGTNKNDAFLLSPVQTPFPGAVILGLLGLGAAGLRMRRLA